MDNLLDYEYLIYGVIKKYGKGYEYDDLYQVGMIGLIEASKKYDLSVGSKFSSYAYYYVLGEVIKFISESKTIKISKDIRNLKKSINSCIEIMEQKLGRIPSVTEISLFLDIDENKVVECLEITNEVRSLDSYFCDEGSLYEFIGFNDNDFNPDILDLRDELSKLSEEEMKLIYDRYFNSLSQVEVSKNYGISQAKVSRLEGKILQKLKERL